MSLIAMFFGSNGRSEKLDVRRRGRDLPPVIMVAWPDPEGAIRARLPGAIPVWWLKLDGFFGRPFVIRPLPEIAADYAAELSRVYPDGPVHLIGYSAGGLIAADLANRLDAAGRFVRTMLVEPPLPGGLPAAAKLRRRASARVKIGTNRALPTSTSEAQTESLTGGVVRHMRALGRMVPWTWPDYVVPRLIAPADLYQRLEKRFLTRYRESRLRPWLDNLAKRGRTIPRRHREWWYYYPQLQRRVLEYCPPAYRAPLHLAGSRDWLTIHAPTWHALARPGNLFLCEVPETRNHHDSVKYRHSRAWLDVVGGWYGSMVNG